VGEGEEELADGAVTQEEDAAGFEAGAEGGGGVDVEHAALWLPVPEPAVEPTVLVDESMTVVSVRPIYEQQPQLAREHGDPEGVQGGVVAVIGFGAFFAEGGMMSALYTLNDEDGSGRRAGRLVVVLY